MLRKHLPVVVRKYDPIEGGTMTNYGEGNLRLYNYRGLRDRLQNFTFSVFDDRPHWQSLDSLGSLFRLYERNPVFYAIVQIKARADSNKRYQVVNKKNGKVEPTNSQKDIPRKLYRLMARPNVMQAAKEFIKQKKIFREVTGNSLTYANSSFGFKPRWDTTSALWNVWPEHMDFELAGKYFEATEKKDIIRKWKFSFKGYKKEFGPEEKKETSYQ